MNVELIKSAMIRAIRTFVQTFLFTLSMSVANVVDLSTAKAVVLAAGSAALALAWRAFLDPMPVPTLADPYPTTSVPRAT